MNLAVLGAQCFVKAIGSGAAEDLIRHREGQVIRAAARNSPVADADFRLDRVGFVELEKGTFFLVAMNVPLRQLRGRLMGKRRVSIDEMNPAKFARNLFSLD